MSRHRNDGLRKRCPCPRRNWAKCPHSWHFSFKWKGVHYRVSLERETGRRIEGKTEAEAEADRLRTLIRGGTFQSQRAQQEQQASTVDTPPAETLKVYAQAWLRTGALTLKASTMHFYTDHLQNHIFPLLGMRPISAVSRADCRLLITTAREKGLKISTVRGIARALSTVLSQAVEDNHLPANPALRLGKYLRRADEPKPQIDPLSRDEAMQLVETAREHFSPWHAWVLCALRTGLRHGELLALQWGDIDWGRGFIVVRRNLVRGKLTTPKNHQTRRVDMSRQLRVVLRLSLRQQRAKWFKHGRSKLVWVFPSEVGTPLDESNVRKVFKQLLEKAELRHRRVHDLRHSFASLLIQQGESLAYVKEQMGHSSIQITVDTYGHLVPGGNRAAVDRLDLSPELLAQTLHRAPQSAVRRPA